VISSNGALPPISPYQLQAYKIGQSAPFSGIPVFSGAVGAVFNPATEEVFSLQTDGTLTIGKETVSLSSNVSTITLYEERFLRATKLGVKSLALDTRTGDIYYTGSAAQSAQSGQAASARHAIYVFGNSPPAGGTGDSQTGDN
jgi:hypothetical protein